LGLEASVFSPPTLGAFRKSGERVGAHTGGLAGDDLTQPLGGGRIFASIPNTGKSEWSIILNPEREVDLCAANRALFIEAISRNKAPTLLGFRVVADHQQSCAGVMLQDNLRRRASLFLIRCSPVPPTHDNFSVSRNFPFCWNQFCLTTSFGSLSSRSPRKLGPLILLSLVHS
jgi:hypothetical protein